MEFKEFVLVIVTALGFVSAFKYSIKFLKWVWIMFLRPPKNLKEYGSWAMITGGADGIGKALALELASKGLNLVLVDKDTSKLEATTREIRELLVQEVEVKGVVIDLAKCSGKEIVNIIDKEIKGLDVGVLINNAGLGGFPSKFFHEVDFETIESCLKVNIEALTWVTFSVLPGMLKKKKGAILNMGSLSGSAPSYPLHTIYGSTKAYVSMFSRCINLEYKQSGIDIQCQTPAYVATKMTNSKPSFLIPSPTTFGKASVRSIGYEQICVPYWPHSIQWFIINMFPDALVSWGIYSKHFAEMKNKLRNLR